MFRVTILSFFVCLSILYSAPSSGGDCGNHVNLPLKCRELPDTSLGDRYCFLPDGLPVYAVKEAEIDGVFASPEGWTFELGGVSGSPPPGVTCTQGPTFDQNYHVQIKRNKNGDLFIRLSYSSGKPFDVVLKPVADLTGNVVFLEGEENGTDYFVLLRNRMSTGKKLPKFLYVLAYAKADTQCLQFEPRIDATVVRSSCKGAYIKPLVKGGGFAETTIGGGGEHK